MNEAQLAAEIAAYKAVFPVSRPRDFQKYAAIDRNDPDTWRRPNLDHLKASILADWKADAEAERLLDLVAQEHPPLTDRKDPNTWRQPNLDKLKASIVADQKVEAAKALHAELFHEDQSPAVPNRQDPTTWRRPNLDNLKASIAADWKASA